MNFGNLHKLAASAIPQQTLELKRFKCRVLNDEGVWINKYKSAETIKGSLQPMDSRTAKEHGLDTSKRYQQLWTNADIKQAGRDAAPDRIKYKSKSFDVVGVTDWQAQDGWSNATLVEVQDE
jgi:head-tail adaptor